MITCSSNQVVATLVDKDVFSCIGNPTILAEDLGQVSRYKEKRKMHEHYLCTLGYVGQKYLLQVRNITLYYQGTLSGSVQITIFSGNFCFLNRTTCKCTKQ